ncbi:hypothetical protein GOODEAATRI_031047 [Goodea atripinnis]|uniref:Uncharacterized protein n=1 Tax=Goodea atripinnis TaxID=208336 RepID=A0ABV0NGM1_9TELE
MLIKYLFAKKNKFRVVQANDLFSTYCEKERRICFIILERKRVRRGKWNNKKEPMQEQKYLCRQISRILVSGSRKLTQTCKSPENHEEEFCPSFCLHSGR